MWGNDTFSYRFIMIQFVCLTIKDHGVECNKVFYENERKGETMENNTNAPRFKQVVNTSENIFLLMRNFNKFFKKIDLNLFFYLEVMGLF